MAQTNCRKGIWLETIRKAGNLRSTPNLCYSYELLDALAITAIADRHRDVLWNFLVLPICLLIPLWWRDLARHSNQCSIAEDKDQVRNQLLGGR